MSNLTACDPACRFRSCGLRLLISTWRSTLRPGAASGGFHVALAGGRSAPAAGGWIRDAYLTESLPRSSNGRTRTGPGRGYPTPAAARRAMLLLGLGLVLALASWLLLVLALSPPSQTATTEPVGAAKPTLPNLRLVHELQTLGPVSTLVWSSDGTKLAAGSLGGRFPPFNIQNPYGKVITIWDSSGHVIQQIQREGEFFVFDSTFAFVSGDTQLVTPPVSASGAFALFDVTTGEFVREVPKPRDVGGANVLVASPDQSILAVSFRYAMRHCLNSAANFWQFPVGPDKSGR